MSFLGVAAQGDASDAEGNSETTGRHTMAVFTVEPMNIDDGRVNCRTLAKKKEA
jgi:hypothetical protein